MTKRMGSLKKKVLLIGAGKHAMVIAEKIFDIPDLELYGFTDRGTPHLPDFITKKGYKILGDDRILSQLDKDVFIHLGLGGDLLQSRKKIIAEIERLGLKTISVVHPTANIALSSCIGKGTTVLVGASVNTNAKIGNFCCVNTKAAIEHDCVIGNNVFLQPGSVLGGNVVVGDDTVIGIGASVRDNIRIGKNCIIGGGAFVCSDIPDNSIAYGVPAKVVGNKS